MNTVDSTRLVLVLISKIGNRGDRLLRFRLSAAALLWLLLLFRRMCGRGEGALVYSCIYY